MLSLYLFFVLFANHCNFKTYLFLFYIFCKFFKLENIRKAYLSIRLRCIKQFINALINARYAITNLTFLICLSYKYNNSVHIFALGMHKL